jgi:hypothetical protein
MQMSSHRNGKVKSCLYFVISASPARVCVLALRQRLASEIEYIYGQTELESFFSEIKPITPAARQFQTRPFKHLTYFYWPMHVVTCFRTSPVESSEHRR